MALPSIRGHQGRLRFFQDGAEVGFANITNAEVTQDSSFSRAFYVGNPVGEGDQSIEGWSGSIDVEVKDDQVDAFIDALVENNLGGVGISDYAMVVDEFYPNGQSASYVYFDMQFKMNKSVAGLNEKQTKRLEFQAAGRTRL